MYYRDNRPRITYPSDKKPPKLLPTGTKVFPERSVISMTGKKDQTKKPKKPVNDPTLLQSLPAFSSNVIRYPSGFKPFVRMTRKKSELAPKAPYNIAQTKSRNLDYGIRQLI